MACPSPSFDNPLNPCGATIAGDSRHCATHADILRPYYLRYKNMEINHILDATNESLVELSIEQLLKYISKVEKVYNMRSEHRRLAFVPSLWDRGHDIMIEKCIKCVYKIKNTLEMKFNKEVEQTEPDNNEDLSTDTGLQQTASKIQKLSVVCEKIQQEESSWEDSEAIKIYTIQQSRMKICYNIIWKVYHKYITECGSFSKTKKQNRVIVEAPDEDLLRTYYNWYLRYMTGVYAMIRKCRSLIEPSLQRKSKLRINSFAFNLDRFADTLEFLVARLTKMPDIIELTNLLFYNRNDIFIQNADYVYGYYYDSNMGMVVEVFLKDSNRKLIITKDDKICIYNK